MKCQDGEKLSWLTTVTNPVDKAAFSTLSTVAWATSLAPATAASATTLACSVVFWDTGRTLGCQPVFGKRSRDHRQAVQSIDRGFRGVTHPCPRTLLCPM